MGQSLLKGGPRKKKRVRTSVDAEKLFMGNEPIVPEFPESGIDQTQIYNWYNYFTGADERVKYVVAYMNLNNYAPECVRMAKAGGKLIITNVAASLARLHTNGTKGIPKILMDNVHTNIQEAIEIGRAKIQPKDANVYRPSVHEMMMEKVGDLIGELEVVLDNENYEFDTYAFLKEREVPGKLAKMVGEYYEPIATELEAAVQGAFEGYPVGTCAQASVFVRSIVDDCNKISDIKKAVRKPRKTVIKSVLKQIDKLKYEKVNDEYKIASVDPAKIIGAYAVYLFNTKNNALNLLVAQTTEGLSVSGTTIKGYDVERSCQKAVRNAKDFVDRIQKCTKRSVDKKRPFEELSSKERGASGRVNETTLILKVIA